METKLKDVLHLYIGCQIKEMKLDVIITLTIFTPKTLYKFKNNTFKLILRRFDDMTEEEKVEYKSLQYSQRATPVHQIYVNTDSSQSFAWLLKNGFDIYNLILSGDAIDKKTLNL